MDFGVSALDKCWSPEQSRGLAGAWSLLGWVPALMLLPGVLLTRPGKDIRTNCPASQLLLWPSACVPSQLGMGLCPIRS
jgi:hypothetical protein